MLLGRIHEGYVYDRRSKVLSEMMAHLLPKGSRVLDVGCGDGLITKAIQLSRDDIEIEGVDVLLRPAAHVPVRRFDGKRLPYGDRSFDAVMFVDVLHHADDPSVLISEAVRVSRSLLVIKDHCRDGLFAYPTLRFMDYVGNARHGVAIPANYWPERLWRDRFAALGLVVDSWTKDVPLYPRWASWLFGRSLHFVATLSNGRT